MLRVKTIVQYVNFEHQINGDSKWWVKTKNILLRILKLFKCLNDLQWNDSIWEHSMYSNIKLINVYRNDYQLDNYQQDFN